MPKKSHKNGAGEGSIRKRGNDRWEARITTGYDPETGRQIQKSLYGKTREEVSKKLTAIKSSLDNGTYTEPSKMKTGEWIEHWMKNYAMMTLKDSTVENYRFLINTHILPGIGQIPLDKLKTSDLQQFYNERFQHRKDSESKGLSVSTVKHIHNIIHKALNQARKEGLIRINPDDACTMPKQEKRKVDTIPMEDIAAFLHEAEQGKHYALFYLDLSTGLRRGELLALKWEDIDFGNKTLTVSRQLNRVNGKLRVSTLKTVNSNRTIRLPESAVEVLTRHKAEQEGQKQLMKELWKDNGLVFCNEYGEPYDPSGIYHYFKRMVKRLGLSDRRFHDLRHTFATIALQNGVDIKTIQESLGHYSAGFTLQVYGHVTRQMQDSAARKIDDFLTGESEKSGG